jgi:hypothetical protein
MDGMPKVEEVVLGDQALWSVLNSSRRPLQERQQALFEAVKLGTPGFKAAQDLELVIRAKPRWP